MGVLDLTSGSSINQSTTPLGAGLTFTGSPEYNQYSYVLVTCKADVAGTLFIDFSDTGLFEGEQNTFPVNGFSVAAGVYEIHSAYKGNRHFRVRYVNGSTDQTSFRLNVYFSYVPIHLNAPLNQSVGLGSDAQLVRMLDPSLEISRGSFSSVQGINKFGYNADVDTVSIPEDLWNVGGLWVPPTSAQVMNVVSTDANDTLLGTGTRTLTIEGLDENWVMASETVDMDGTTIVPTTTTFRRVFRAYSDESGSGGVNAGAISVTAAVDATLQANIIAGYGQTTLGFYTVPAGFTAYITSWNISFYQTSNTNTALIALFERCGVNGSSPSLRIKDNVRLVVGSQTDHIREYKPYLKINEYCDILIRILDVNANNNEFAGGFDVILVPNT